MYTFGAYGMNIVDNEFFDNVMYGIDPHDDSDALVVGGNRIHDNGNHGFICSKRCDGLSIRNNVSSSNAGVGFMLHRAVVNSVVEGNTAEHNGTGGFAIVDSYDNVFRHNVARGNQYGIRLSTGASDNLIADNDFSGNTEYGIYTYLGADPPSINDGRVARNRFLRNDVSRNGTLGVRADDSSMNLFVGNLFQENGQYAVFLQDAHDNVFQQNDLGGSYIVAQGDSSNVVADTDSVEVLIADGQARFTVTDASGRVFQNPQGLETVIAAEGSALTLSGAAEAGVLPIDALPLAVVPVGGPVGVSVLAWGEAGRTWRTAATEAARATFVIAGLRPGARYLVQVDGERSQVTVADSTGAIEFSADLGPVVHAFSVAPIRWIGAPPVPVSPTRRVPISEP